MINQTLNNRYKVTALLGKGAMGDVYRATDIQTGQDVAIKVITQNLAFDQEMLERFRREGEALRRLRHPNIVGFVDMFQFEGHQAIVMEYVPGGNLHALIKNGPLPLDRAHHIALDLCDALTRAHRLNIIHRDLKPENVLITEDDTPKLTDFGVARLLGETARITSTGALVGTPFYMSPEAWQGKTLDEQTDIWSLGVVLYEMLSGKVPFAGETLPAVMNKVLTEQPPDLKTLRPDVPPALAKIIQRMLRRDKTKRYASMREVALDLERGMKEAGSSQDSEGTTIKEKEPKAKARGAWPVWTVVALGTLVVAGLLAIGGLGLWAVIGRPLAGAATQTATRPLSLTSTSGLPSAVPPTQPVTPILQPSTPEATATQVAATQTNAPSVPASNIVLGQILLQTDFEDGKLTGFSHADGWWKVVKDATGNHVLDQDNRKGRNHWNRILFGDMTWKNYVVECRMRFVDADPSDSEWTHAGVDARYEDLDTAAGQYSSFMTIRGTTIGIGYGNDRTSRYLNLAQSSNGDVVMNQWYKVRLEVNGDTYKFFIDDAEVLEAADSTSLSGPAGFHVGPALHVQFDDVRVTEILPSPTNPPTPTATETPSPQSTVDITPVSAFIPGAQVTYQTKFDDMIDWGANGSADFANGHLTVNGNNGGAGHTIPLSKGYGMLVLFRCTSGTNANIVLFGAGNHNDREIGIQNIDDFSVSLNYGGAWHGGQRLNGNLRFVADRWYYALIEIKNGGQFYLKVWPQDDLSSYGEKTLPMGTQWDNSSWYGTVNVNADNTGRIEVASYQEFRIGGP